MRDAVFNYWDTGNRPRVPSCFLYYVKDRAIMDFSFFSFDPNIKKKVLSS